MKKISELTIRKIADLIAVSNKAFGMSPGSPDRPPGGYRTWPQLISFFQKINPLIPNSEEVLTKLIHELKGTPLEKRQGFSREDLTRELLKIWNEKDVEIFKKIFEELLNPQNYFPGYEAEILRVYSAINIALNEEKLFFGGNPLTVYNLEGISADEKAKLEWDVLWYLASKIFSTNQQLREKVSSLMLQGHFNDIARNAAEMPFELLQNKSKELKDKDGEELISAALRKNGILFYGFVESKIEEWARKRLAVKLSALYQAYRNPASHHFRIENPWEAILAVWNANWCISEIEKISEKSKEDDIPF